MSDTVSIVIVSHSRDVARGAGDMVHQMVGDEVRVACCGGDPGGGLGTDVAAIMEAIKSVYSPKGVAILVDLGGAETNSEMAITDNSPAASRLRFAQRQQRAAVDVRRARIGRCSRKRLMSSANSRADAYR